MIIPVFEEKTIPVLYMDVHINEEPSEEAKQFKLILESIKTFECLPKVSEMTAILEYEQKALDYLYILAVNTLDKVTFEKNVTDIYNAVNNKKTYSKCLKDSLLFAKYCTIQKVLNELLIIDSIKNAVNELMFDLNNHERQVLTAITDLKE